MFFMKNDCVDWGGGSSIAVDAIAAVVIRGENKLD